MTGSGTQNDPYVVDNWTDFITAVGTASAYVELKKTLVQTSDTVVNLNKIYLDSNGDVKTEPQNSDLASLYENTFTLDANDYAEGGLTATITMTCSSLNGNGATIKNLSSTAANIFAVPSGITLTAIAILNVNCKNHSFITSEWSGAYGSAQNCIFSGRIDSSNADDSFIKSPQIIYIDCGFTAQLFNSAKFAYYDSYYGYPQFRGCNIDTTDHRTISTEYPDIVDMNNSYWGGNYNHSIRDAMGTYDYTVFDVTCPAIDGNNDSIREKMFINSDKCTSVGTGCVSVTTAQLSSAAALSALGFPIEI